MESLRTVGDESGVDFSFQDQFGRLVETFHCELSQLAIQGTLFELLPVFLLLFCVGGWKGGFMVGWVLWLSGFYGDRMNKKIKKIYLKKLKKF